MADTDKNYLVDPDPAWNYAIPDSSNPSIFHLTLPVQAKWLTGSHPHPTPTHRCVPITYHMSPPFIYEGSAVAVLFITSCTNLDVIARCCFCSHNFICIQKTCA